MSFWELSLVGVIALIVLGPERLPKAARAIGLWVGKAKQGFESIKTEIDRELKVKELQEQLLAHKEEIENDSSLGALKDDLDNSINTIHSQTAQLNQTINSADTLLNDKSISSSSEVDEDSTTITGDSDSNQKTSK